ncbi:hypothetical protein HY417_01630 [Candidatus Kaiserbacteria bacterium]|nr:hypothetical protein [Candidatus Kaiserbacteria bacterium]
MADTKMPEPSNEWTFPERRKPYTRIIVVQMKNFSMRLKHAGTMRQLEVIKRDILRSALVANMQAIQELRTIANVRAVELKYKNPKGGEWWR